MSDIEKQTSHYEIFNLQPLEYMEQEKIYGYVAKIFKYIARYPFKHKDWRIDLDKALYSLNLMLEMNGGNYRVDFTPFILENWEILKEKQILMLCCLGSKDYIKLREMLKNERISFARCERCQFERYNSNCSVCAECGIDYKNFKVKGEKE